MNSVLINPATRESLGLATTDKPVFAGGRFGTGSDYTDISATGFVSHAGAAQVWDDTLMPATAINPVGPDGSMTIDTTSILGALVAGPSSTPSCFAIFQLPHSYAVGTAVSLHVHYLKTDATDNAGTVVLEAKWITSPIGLVCTPTYSSYVAGTIAVDTGDTKLKHGIKTWTIPATDLGISSIIPVVIRRNGGTSGDITIIGIDIHFRRGQAGSSQETSI